MYTHLVKSNADQNYQNLCLSCRLSAGSGKELQFGGRARYSKSPELIETTFSMSTIAEEDQQDLSLKSIPDISATSDP